MLSSARWIDNNTAVLDGAKPSWTPQQVRAMPLNSGEASEFLVREFMGELSVPSWQQVPGQNVWFSNDPVTMDPRRGLYFRKTSGGTIAEGLDKSTDVSSAITDLYDWAYNDINDILSVYAESDPNSFYDAIYSGVSIAENTNQISIRKLQRRRVIYHPGFDEEIVYPELPDRTVGYYHGPLRVKELKLLKSLQGGVASQDKEFFDEVLVQEVWGVGNNRLAMLSSFFEALQLFTLEDPPLGQQVAWVPHDRNFAKHLIQPLSVTIGTAGREVQEVRPDPRTSEDSYVDRQVVFTFKLMRPVLLAQSLLIAEGY